MIDFVIEASKGIIRLKETVYYSSEYLDRAEFMYVIALTVIIGVVTILSVIVALISYRQNKTSDEKTMAAINALNAQIAASKKEMTEIQSDLTSQMEASTMKIRNEIESKVTEYGKQMEVKFREVTKLEEETKSVLVHLKADSETTFTTAIAKVQREARQHRYELMLLQYFTHLQLASQASGDKNRLLYTDAVIGITTKALQDYKIWGYTDQEFHARTYSPETLLAGTASAADNLVATCMDYLVESPNQINRLKRRLTELRSSAVDLFDNSPAIEQLEGTILDLDMLHPESPDE